LTHVPVQPKVVGYIVKQIGWLPSYTRQTPTQCFSPAFRRLRAPWTKARNWTSQCCGRLAKKPALRGYASLRHLGCDYPHWPGAQPQERHFFHLEVDNAPDEWRHVEDNGGTGTVRHPFRLFWLPIEQAALLAAGQGMFAGRLIE
jgi:hypothetical protein